MIRRICVWGAPGAGKSTLTAWLFSQLKIANYDVELVSEYVKRWAHLKRLITSYDQLVLTAKQIKAEDEYLRSGVRHIITDSPVMLSAAHAYLKGLKYADSLRELAEFLDADYPPLNLYLIRQTPYKAAGRYETEAEALATDKYMRKFLEGEYGCVPTFLPLEQDTILRYVKNKLPVPNAPACALADP